VGRFSFALPFVFRYLFPLSFVIYSLGAPHIFFG